jgi:ASC-1-like (ASCH) protein
MQPVVIILLFVFVVVLALLAYHSWWAPLALFIGGADNRLTLFSRDPWMADIVSGKKTVDCRLGTADRFTKYEGKDATILGSGTKVKAQVVSVKQYKTLEDYVSGEGWKKISPHAKSESETLKELGELTKKDGGKIFSKDAINAAGGIVAIEFKVDKASVKQMGAKSKK